MEPFEIRGANLGSGDSRAILRRITPIDKETYLRWFADNSGDGRELRPGLHACYQDDFYNAVWEYNQGPRTTALY